MHTPALGRRVVVWGVSVVVLLSLCLDTLLYASLATSLDDGLDQELARDAQLARAQAVGADDETLARRLAAVEVHATLRDRSGRVLSDDPRPLAGPVRTRDVPLPSGAVARLAVSKADADRSLRHLLALEAVVTPLVVLLAWLLLRLVAEVALRPLDRIAAAARRTAGGRRGERLRPDLPDTRLGQMASAYDEMLDSLEDAVAEAHEARAESERLAERNRQILETAREAFVAVDGDGLIVAWNAEAERVFGWTREEAIGRPVTGTIMPLGGVAGAGTFRATGTVEPSGRVVAFTALHRDGHRFPARMAPWVTRHGNEETDNAFVWDVSRKLESEEAASRLAAVVESTETAMLSVDLDGFILTWNRGATSMYGYTAAEAVGHQVDLVVPDPWLGQVDHCLEAIRQGAEVVHLESQRRRRDGTVIDVAVTVSPIRDAAGAVHAVSSVARDITEERRTAARLEETLGALEAALDEARSSEADTRRFLDDAAHQLRAPITSIRACAEVLLLSDDPAMREELLRSVVAETARAGRLMNGLLRMARLNHGHLPVPQPCDPVQVCLGETARIEAVAPHLRTSVTATGLEAAGMPMLDPHVVAEIVSNLIDNASRHAATGIDVVVHREPRWVNIAVTDDGPGLPEDLAEAAFERFVSLDGMSGSGLGLAIGRELARAHGGDLVYDGDAFVIRLPAADGAGTLVTGALPA